MYYVAPSDGSLDIDLGFVPFFECYSRNITSESTTIASDSYIKIYINALHKRLYAQIKLDGTQEESIYIWVDRISHPDHGLNHTGFKTITMVVDSNEMRVYVNGSLMVTNNEFSSTTIDLASGLGSTNYSPLVIKHLPNVRGELYGKVYVESVEIFSRVLTGSELT
jgi:hypothetical protein